MFLDERDQLIHSLRFWNVLLDLSLAYPERNTDRKLLFRGTPHGRQQGGLDCSCDQHVQTKPATQSETVTPPASASLQCQTALFRHGNNQAGNAALGGCQAGPIQVKV